MDLVLNALVNYLLIVPNVSILIPLSMFLQERDNVPLIFAILEIVKLVLKTMKKVV